MQVLFCVEITDLYQYMTPIKPRGLLPYISHMYRHVLPRGVWFLRRFGLKKSIKFPFLVWNREWFLKELREYVFVVSLIPSDQERKRNMRIRKGF